jgi:hypothetical protein
MASLSPQKVDFEKIWSGLAEGIGKIITLTGVKGMPMIEYVFPLLKSSRDLNYKRKSFACVTFIFHATSVRFVTNLRVQIC